MSSSASTNPMACRRVLVALLLAAAPAKALLGRPVATRPSRRRAPASPPAPTGVPADALALGTCAAGWAALCTQTLGVDRARSAVGGALGLAQRTFEDCVREPAGGFLDLTSVLSLLDIALLVILAASLGPQPRPHPHSTRGHRPRIPLPRPSHAHLRPCSTQATRPGSHSHQKTERARRRRWG